MFHRILSPDDPRWPTSDPEYTLSDGLFGACLDFFQRHYNVIAPDALLANRSVLPPRPLLITFDDGWADNHTYALPALRGRGLPGLLFVVADAIDRREPFWQEALVHAFLRGTLQPADCATLWRGARPPGNDDPAPACSVLDDLRTVVARLEALDENSRDHLLADVVKHARLTSDERQMMTTSELRAMAAGGITIGVHGKTHTPLPRAANLDAELAEARSRVAAALGGTEAPTTMSFPHGRYTTAIVHRAQAEGFRLLFTSDSKLNLVPPGERCPPLLGRVGFTANDIVDDSGRFAPERLASLLFRRAADVLRA